MKKILLILTLFTSFNLLSQKYNMDYNYNSIDRVWSIDTKIIDNTVVFNWEKDIVTYIHIKSSDNELVFPKVDAFMTSQLTLNSLNIGKYEVLFLDDCSAIMYTKEFEIK